MRVTCQSSQLDSCEWPPFSRMRRKDGRRDCLSAHRSRVIYFAAENGVFSLPVNSRLPGNQSPHDLGDLSSVSHAMHSGTIEDAEALLMSGMRVVGFLPQFSLQATMYIGIIDFLQVCSTLKPVGPHRTSHAMPFSGLEFKQAVRTHVEGRCLHCEQISSSACKCLYVSHLPCCVFRSSFGGAMATAFLLWSRRRMPAAS
jgi:hypothetical protein